MFEFGDELIIESYRIPWLIWIQLLVMFLLVILLYYFTTTSSESDLSFHFSTAAATASPSLTGVSYNRSLIGRAAHNHHDSKDRENEIKETETSTSELVQRTNKPNGRQREGPSTIVEGDGLMLEHPHHPCNFFGFAKQVFLKCLGFDSSPENPTRRRHEKDD